MDGFALGKEIANVFKDGYEVEKVGGSMPDVSSKGNVLSPEKSRVERLASDGKSDTQIQGNGAAEQQQQPKGNVSLFEPKAALEQSGIPDVLGNKNKDLDLETIKEEQQVIEGTDTVLLHKPNYLSDKDYRGRMMDSIKLAENPTRKGFKGGKWNMIPSANDSKTLNPTQLEIGYGVVVRPDWIGTDRSKWLKVDGVPVDLRQGVDQHQMDSIVNDLINESQDNLSSVVGKKTFDSMQPPFKAYWTKVAYNGGAGILYKKGKDGKKVETNMLKQLKAGNPVEAMQSAFTAWWSGDGAKRQPMRGLLNRRLTDYNEAAKDMGLPLATDYEWGGGKATIHFDSKFNIGVSKAKKGQDTLSYNEKGIRQSKVSKHSPDSKGVFY